MKLSIKTIVFAGLFAALACIATMFVPINLGIPGYYHAGDSMVFLCGIVLGPTVGGLAAAIGSAMADVFAGYAAYAVPTFLIKGIDAFAAGFIFMKIVGENGGVQKKVMAFLAAAAAGCLVVVTGYFLVEVLFSGFGGALTTIVPNIVQVLVGAVLAALIYSVLDKAGVVKMINREVKESVK